MKDVKSVGDVDLEAGLRQVGAPDPEVAEDDPRAGAFYHGEGFHTCGRRPGYYARNAGATVAAMARCRPLT